MVYLPTPGLKSLGDCPTPGPGRGLYLASNQVLFAAVGSGLYRVNTDWTMTLLGQLSTSSAPVSMSDNGQTLVAVDGSSFGWQVDLTSGAFSAITDPAFYGATRADFLDTFFLFNNPGTNQWYCSQSEAVTFDSLYIVAKSSSPGPVAGVAVLGSEVWIIGLNSGSEVWFDSGASDFPFQRVPTGVIPHGTIAAGSIASTGDELLFLGADPLGERVLYAASGFQVQRVSTHGVEEAWRSYSFVQDAIAYTRRQAGHTFYVLTFPTADATWVFEPALGEAGWHQWQSLGADGRQHRHRVAWGAHAYNALIGQDWQTGALYLVSLDAYDDAGSAVQRVRSFPHMVNDGRQVLYSRFAADMEPGETAGPGAPPISLRWSDTRGLSWGNPVTEDLGLPGQFDRSVSFRQLGIARDRVFELSWDAPVRTSLLGAFVDVVPCGT